MVRVTRTVRIGSLPVGGGSPVSVQSMTRAAWDDVPGALAEITAAAQAGCDVMRLAVPSVAAAKCFGQTAARSPLPLVADTHFDWRTAVAAITQGAAKVRINPGNMQPDGLRRVVDAAGEKGIPIRIGGNSGSILHRRGIRTGVDMATVMAEEALDWARRMDDMGFRDTVISLKSHDVRDTVRANRLVAAAADYPLHLGVTSAGGGEEALCKSAAALGALLVDGIGETIRLSFTGDMAGEIAAGIRLLRAVGARRDGVEVISCPACGRCRVSLPVLAERVRERVAGVGVPLRVAVMGCEVNGPGEARMADAGIASAGGVVHVFVGGEVVARVREEEAVERLGREVERLAAERGRG